MPVYQDCEFKSCETGISARPHLPKNGKAGAVDKKPLFPVSFPCNPEWVLTHFYLSHANHSAIGQKKKEISEGENQGAGFVLLFQYARKSSCGFLLAIQTRSLPEGFYDHTEKTELSLA